MVFLHRKILYKPFEVDNNSFIPDFTITLPPISLPLPPPPQKFIYDQSLSPFLIIMFCGLTVCFSFICYLTFAKLWHQRNRRNTDHEDIANEDLGPVTQNPIWLINTIGLDQSQIESIGFFKYKRDEKLTESIDCSVCLSEFENDESLRLLPKCSHAFHVPCIDTWLRSHKNCPLCRAPIFKNTNDHTEHAIAESNLVESSTSGESELPVSDSETSEDHHVFEVENNGDTVKTSGILDENTVANDHHHVQVNERVLNSHQLVGSKKQSSMPKGGHKLKLSSSSSSIHIRRKPMKSSSFGHPIRKASSFTSKCRPHNQSY